MESISIDDCAELSLETTPEGFTKLVVDNALARCELYLHGATVSSFVPKGEKDLLWLSPNAVFRQGKGIRGGIPICWPWFGNHVDDNTKPAHGFARHSQWQLSSAQTTDDGVTELVLTLSESENTRQVWPYKFDLRYHITIGSQLNLALTMINTNDCDIEISGALHTYFAIGDIAHASIAQENVATYTDKLDGQTKRGATDTNISGPTDRIYHDCDDVCRLDDKNNERVIEIAKSGSDSMIVWNPWAQQSTEMADMPNDGYKKMLCIEAGYTDMLIVKPGEQHTLSQSMTIRTDV